jgi:serine/threonine-protein kinase RsbW
MAQVDEFVESIAERLGFDESSRADISISVTEAVNNAIVHGNLGDVAKKVDIEVEGETGRMTIRVSDGGEGFDPDDQPNPVAEENLLRRVGRGIFILRSLMDEVRFDISPKRGTMVEMTKRCS